MAGDLLGVPRRTTHWFDTGAVPDFTAIRFFRAQQGWVGIPTGSDIARRFPDGDAASAGAGHGRGLRSAGNVTDATGSPGALAEIGAELAAEAQTGTMGVAATLRRRDRLASRRPGVMFVGAPVPGSRGPVQQEQLLILNRQVRVPRGGRAARTGPGRECSLEAW